MPGARLPIDPATGTPWYSEDDLKVFRLSSKSHWDLPLIIPLDEPCDEEIHAVEDVHEGLAGEWDALGRFSSSSEISGGTVDRTKQQQQQQHQGQKEQQQDERRMGQKQQQQQQQQQNGEEHREQQQKEKRVAQQQPPQQKEEQGQKEQQQEKGLPQQQEEQQRLETTRAEGSGEGQLFWPNRKRKVVHFLVHHPTPPVFDGAEHRNRLRNHDEIRFFADYVGCGAGGGRSSSGADAASTGAAGGPRSGGQELKGDGYMYDDAGRGGGLPEGEKGLLEWNMGFEGREGGGLS